MTCPVCGDTVTELIEHPKLDELVCYFCAVELLGLPNVKPEKDESDGR